MVRIPTSCGKFQNMSRISTLAVSSKIVCCCCCCACLGGGACGGGGGRLHDILFPRNFGLFWALFNERNRVLAPSTNCMKRIILRSITFVVRWSFLFFFFMFCFSFSAPAPRRLFLVSCCVVLCRAVLCYLVLSCVNLCFVVVFPDDHCLIFIFIAAVSFFVFLFLNSFWISLFLHFFSNFRLLISRLISSHATLVSFFVHALFAFFLSFFAFLFS